MSVRPRKLTLWNTQKFTPLIDHKDELQPIMEILGFRDQPSVTKLCSTATTIPQWIVYTHPQKQRRSKALVAEEQPPNPTLPYPTIDGLHPSIYRDFLNNVNFYLNMDDISDLFHVRGIHMLQSDLNVKWHPIEEDITLKNYFYKEGTGTDIFYGTSNGQVDDDDDKNLSIRNRGKVLPPMNVKPLKDIITILSDDAER